YGLGSRPGTAEVQALARLKGRAPDKPFLLLIAGYEMAEAQGLAFNESARALARAFWPGPLTIVLPGGGGRLPDLLRGPEGGIGGHRAGGRRGGLRTSVPRRDREGARPLRTPRPPVDARAGRRFRPRLHDGPPSPRPGTRAGRRRPRARAGGIRRTFRGGGGSRGSLRWRPRCLPGYRRGIGRSDRGGRGPARD